LLQVVSAERAKASGTLSWTYCPLHMNIGIT